MSDDLQFGWVDDPDAVGEVVSELEYQSFGATPAADIRFEDIPDHVHGWEVYKSAAGQDWPEFNQGQIGSCVSFGTTQAILFSMSAERIAGQGERVVTPCMEAIYGGSRVEVGGGKLNGDGSIGAWAAKWIKNWGIIPQDVFGEYDLTKYKVDRCREWGKTGVPDVLEPIAKEHPIADYVPVLTFENACKALASGYGINVCSRQGFSLERDQEGFCKPEGTWAHSMAFIGYRKGKRPGLFVVNSWGFKTTTGPTPGDSPKSGWWVDASVADRMLRGGDSFAYADVKGFPIKKIDWSLI